MVRGKPGENDMSDFALVEMVVEVCVLEGSMPSYQHYLFPTPAPSPIPLPPPMQAREKKRAREEKRRKAKPKEKGKNKRATPMLRNNHIPIPKNRFHPLKNPFPPTPLLKHPALLLTLMNTLLMLPPRETRFFERLMQTIVNGDFVRARCG